MKSIIIFVIIAIIIVVAVISIGSDIKEDTNLEFGDTFDNIFTFSFGTSSDSQPRITTTTVPISQNSPQASAPSVPVQTTPEVQKPVITPPAGFSVDDLSPFYEQVQLSQVTRSSTYYKNSGSFVLQGQSKLGDEVVNVTGWHVRSNRGNPIRIPQAVRNFSSLETYAETNIFLGKSDYMRVYGAESPMGRGLRLNKCTGYLNNRYDFNPSLPSNCPSIQRGEISSLTGRCQSYLLSLWGCKEPTPEEINEYSGPKDAGCGGYLDYKTYNGCYRVHQGDEGFFSNEWRVWVNQDFGFDGSHDRIVLYDLGGKVVDVYTY